MTHQPDTINIENRPMIQAVEEDEHHAPPPVLALPRPRWVPCQCPPMAVQTSHKAATVTQADLVAHAGRPDVVGVLCVSSSYTSVQTGGAQMPDVTHLYTRKPRLLEMWPGDALRLTAAKPGWVLLLPMVPA
jgi:hypothetical protein